MATSVTQSLFGMTPEALQAQRDAMLNKQAFEFAQMTPMQQAQMGLFRGASQLGTGLAGLMGYQDPEMQRIKARQGLLGGIDMSDPAALRQAAQQAQQSGDFAAAQELVTRAVSLETSMAEQEKARAEAAAKLREGVTPEQKNAAGWADTVAQRGTPEWAMAYRDKLKELTTKEGATKAIKEIGVAKGTGQPVYYDQNTDQQFIMETVDGKQVRVPYSGSVDRSTSNVRVEAKAFTQAEEAYGNVVGKDVANRDINLIETADTAVAALPKLRETLALIERGNINVGIAAGLQDTISRARSKFLGDKEAGINVADSQYLDSLLGSEVFGQIAALGIGARGLDTPAEREFLKEVITGTRALDRETLRRMTQFRIDALERGIDRYNDKLKSGALNKYQQVTARQLAPVTKPASKTERPPLDSFKR